MSLGLLTLLLLTLSGSAFGDISPVGCTGNGLDITVSRPNSTVKKGGTIPYTVRIENPTDGGVNCDVKDATVTLQLPDDTTGAATGTVVTVAGPIDYPAGTDVSYTFSTIPAMEYSVPAGANANSYTAAARVVGSLRSQVGGYDSLNKTGDISTTLVDARIGISATGTNKVGDAHTFTVKVEKRAGGTWSDASGVTVAPSFITNTIGATINNATSTCVTGTTSGTGECTIVVNSSSVGTATVKATATVATSGEPTVPTVAVDTNGYGANGTIGNSKTWVDARINIAASGTNNVGDPHTFTVTVQKNPGSGWVAASGVTVTPTFLTNAIGATINNATSTCVTGTTNGSGQCTVVVNSASAGTVTVRGAGTVTVSGVNIAVATNGYGAYGTIGNQKTWVAPTPPPPPPPPPAPKADVAITKTATAQVTLVNGSATIVYDLTVRNNGPDAAQSVTVADAAPSGVTLVSIAQQPAQGSCSIGSGGALLSCTIGALANGAAVSFRVNGTVTQTGTVSNCATTTTTTAETNAANNQSCAPTVVVAPVTPPKPKPKPAVLPEVCNTVTAGPKMLKANGKKQSIKVTVTQGRKAVAGVKITVSGLGLSKTVTSGKNGVATLTFKPSKAGIVRVAIKNKKACNTQRIGVVGFYEPPVTG